MSNKAGLLLVGFVVIGSFVGAWWWGIATSHPGPVLAWYGLAFALATSDAG